MQAPLFWTIYVLKYWAGAHLEKYHFNNVGELGSSSGQKGKTRWQPTETKSRTALWAKLTSAIQAKSLDTASIIQALIKLKKYLGEAVGYLNRQLLGSVILLNCIQINLCAVFTTPQEMIVAQTYWASKHAIVFAPNHAYLNQAPSGMGMQF